MRDTVASTAQSGEELTESRRMSLGRVSGEVAHARSGYALREGMEELFEALDHEHLQDEFSSSLPSIMNPLRCEQTCANVGQDLWSRAREQGSPNWQAYLPIA